MIPNVCNAEILTARGVFAVGVAVLGTLGCARSGVGPGTEGAVHSAVAANTATKGKASESSDVEPNGRASPSESPGTTVEPCRAPEPVLAANQCDELWVVPIFAEQWHVSDDELRKEIAALETIVGRLPPGPADDDLQARRRLWQDYREAARRARRRMIAAGLQERSEEEAEACQVERTAIEKSIGYGRSIIVRYSQGQWTYSKVDLVRFVVAYDAYFAGDAPLARMVLSMAPHVPNAKRLLPHATVLEALAEIPREPLAAEKRLLDIDPPPSGREGERIVPRHHPVISAFAIARCYAATVAEMRGDKEQALVAWQEVVAFSRGREDDFGQIPNMARLIHLAREEVVRLGAALQ